MSVCRPSGVLFCLIVGLVLASSVTATLSKNKQHSLVQIKAQSSVVDESYSSCYYNLYLTNYVSSGFGDASMTVAVDGEKIENMIDMALPAYMQESGWKIPVVAGSNITIAYTAGDNSTGNAFSVTDVNGNEVLSQSEPESGTFTIESASCECVYRTECDELRVRNEWRSLSFCGKKLVIGALNALRNGTDSDGNNLYESYIYHHQNYTHAVLLRSLFLPWHRGFIWHFEESMRSLGGKYTCVSLPYWDSSLDFGHENDSEIYDDLGGINYRSCMGEPFAHWTDPVSLGDPELLEDCVYRRAFPATQRFAQFASISSIELGITANWDYGYIFRYLVRDPHKSVHVFVAGSMATLHSPADPLFFLHHANIDRIWAIWQDCWDYDQPGTIHRQYTELGMITPVTFLMPPTYLSTAEHIFEMFNITALGYRYPPVTRELVKLNQSNALTDLQTCKWDWMDKDTQNSLSLMYRLPVHNDEQRTRISTIRKAAAAVLAEDPMDHYGALTSALHSECTMAGGYEADDFNAAFFASADRDQVTGPGTLFRNACKLLEDDMLPRLLI